jgi:hypothetical protein
MNSPSLSACAVLRLPNCVAVNPVGKLVQAWPPGTDEA